MDDLAELLRKNVKAANGFDSVKTTLENLKELREAGFAGRATELVLPFGGRNAPMPRPKSGAEKISRGKLKLTFDV
jgi:hypothetical protein